MKYIIQPIMLLFFISCSDPGKLKSVADRIKTTATITNKYYGYYATGKTDSLVRLFSERLIQRNKTIDTTIAAVQEIRESRGPIRSYTFIGGKIRTYDRPNPKKNRMVLTYRVVYASDTLITKENFYFFFDDTVTAKIDSIHTEYWNDDEQ